MLAASTKPRRMEPLLIGDTIPTINCFLGGNSLDRECIMHVGAKGSMYRSVVELVIQCTLLLVSEQDRARCQRKTCPSHLPHPRD